MKIKYLNIFWLIIPMLFLQPSFACACGQSQSGYSFFIVFILIIYFLPTIAFFKAKDQCQWEFKHVFIPNLLLFFSIF